MKRKEAEKFIEELNSLLQKYNYEIQHYDSLNITDNTDAGDYTKGYIDACYDRKEKKIRVLDYLYLEKESK